MIRIVRLLALFSVVIIFSTFSTQQQQKGVIFLHRGQLVYVANFHQTFVEVKLGGFLQELNQIDQDLRILMMRSQEIADSGAMQIIITLRRQLATIHQKVLDLQITEELLETPLENVENLQESGNEKRNRRGLVNGIGVAASYLFGLATSKEIEETNQKIGLIKATTNHAIEEINKQVTVLQGLGTELSDVHKSIRNVQEQVSGMKLISVKHKQMENLLWIQGNLNDLNIRLNSVVMGLRRMKSGKIATEIVPLNTLKKVLMKLKENDQHLLFNRAEQLALYTDMSIVVQVPAGEYKSLRFVILIPLKDMAQSFHLFELSPIPMWNATLQMGVMYGPVSKYLAVSEDLTTFSPIETLEECSINSENYVCPAGPPIYLQEHNVCEINLYLGGPKLSSNCPRTIYNTASPVFKRTKFGYSYSIPSPMEITVQCEGKPPLVKTVKLDGVGKLKLRGGCHATGQGILLMSPNNEIHEGKDVIVFDPSNKENMSLLTDEEFRRLLHSKALIDKHMERRAKAPIELNQLLNNLDQLQEVEFDKTWNTYSRPGSAIMAVILLIVLIIVVRILCKRRMWILRNIQRRLRRTAPVVENISPHEGTSIIMNPINSSQLTSITGKTNTKINTPTEEVEEPTRASRMTLRSVKQERPTEGGRARGKKESSGEYLL